MGARQAVQASLTYKDTKNNLESVLTNTSPGKNSVIFAGVIKRNNANVGTFSIPVNIPGFYRTMTLSIPAVTEAVKTDFAVRWMNYASLITGLPVVLTVS